MKNTVKIGGIYKGTLKDLNSELNDEELIFLVIREIYLKEINKNIYEILKISKDNKKFKFGIRLINENNEFIILQITNNFYLTEQEIEKFRLIDGVPTEDLEKIIEIRENYQYGEISCEETKKEFEKIKDYHLRIFEIINYI
jgi:hypothetical protein